MAPMMHDQAMRELSRDPDICPGCGGWLGRKPGTKPFCTLANCPGRTAAPPGKPSPPQRTQTAPPTSPPKVAPTPQRERVAIQSAPAPRVRRQVEEDDDPAPRSEASRSRPPPPARTPTAKLSHPALDDEEAAQIRAMALEPLPSCSASGLWASIPKPGLAVLALLWLFGFTDDESSFSLLGGIVTLAPAEKGIVFATLAVLVVTYPFINLILDALRRHCTRRVRRVTLAYALSTLSVLGLLFIIIEPYLPPPGSGESKLQVCLDWGSSPPMIRFDRSRVVGGPCFKLAVETLADDLSKVQ